MKTYFVTINNANNSGADRAFIVHAEHPLKALERALDYSDTSDSTIRAVSLRIATEGDAGTFLS